MKNLKKNFWDRLRHIPYSLKHIFWVNKLAIHYKVWQPRYLFHDVDKIFMYAFCFRKSVQEVHEFHRSYRAHHVDNFQGKRVDWEMSVIDWESAHYTKKDKPMNAAATACALYVKHLGHIIPVLDKFGLLNDDDIELIKESLTMSPCSKTVAVATLSSCYPDYVSTHAQEMENLGLSDEKCYESIQRLEEEQSFLKKWVKSKVIVPESGFWHIFY